MTISRGSLFQAFKYTVYLLLAINIYLFFAQEQHAASLEFSGGVALYDMIQAYAATIDTAAWVILLLMFELETCVLEDRHFTKPVAWTLHGLRATCYTFIVYAFYGYIANLEFVLGATPISTISDLCALAGEWSYAIGLDNYASITAANCNELSAADSFLRFDGVQAVIDAAGHDAQVGLAWIDVINSGVWLLVVLVLEIDVRLQEHNRYEGLVLHLSTFMKVVLYSTLLFAAIYWGIKGDFVDFWDAFLWLIAFVFIELNVFEWRQEELEQAKMTEAG